MNSRYPALIRCAVPGGLAVAVAMVVRCVTAAPPPDVQAILTQHGADPTASAQAVVARGPSAVAELRRLAVSGPAEMVPLAMRAWAAARWTRLGIASTGALFTAEEPAALAAWETLVAERGAAALAVALELSETPGLGARAMRFVPVLLSAAAAVDVAAWIAHQTLTGSDDAERLVRLLMEGAERTRDPVPQARVVEILLLLWRYREALEVAERSFATSSADVFVSLAATAIRRGGSDEALVSAFDRLYRGRADRAGRELELVFWIRVAAQLGRAEPIRGKLRPPDLLRLPPADAAQVVQNLVRLGLASEASGLLFAGQAPFQIYLRAWARRAAGETAAEASDLSTLETSLGNDGELLKGEALAAADVMDRLGDVSAAIRLWKRIIDAQPPGTLHDVNAHLRLARVAESAGDLTNALAHCEEALRISRELDTSTLTGPGGQRGTEWLMRAILELRRRLGARELRNPP